MTKMRQPTKSPVTDADVSLLRVMKDGCIIIYQTISATALIDRRITSIKRMKIYKTYYITNF